MRWLDRVGPGGARFRVETVISGGCVRGVQINGSAASHALCNPLWGQKPDLPQESDIHQRANFLHRDEVQVTDGLA